MEDKPWKNEELKKLEEALPRLKECDLKEASRFHKAKTGVGFDGFHPKVPLDVTEGTSGEIVELLKKVEQSGKWPQKACTRMFFQIPKNITSERPIALVPTWHQKRRHGSRGIALVGTLLTAKWRSPANSVGNSAGDGKI